jgi:hypothetical protein
VLFLGFIFVAKENTMTEPSHIMKPEIEEIPAEIAELVAAIAEVPHPVRDAIEPVLNRVVESAKRRRRVLGMVQDALSQLRLDMKYLVFDLEATRRERDDYRRQLEQP